MNGSPFPYPGTKFKMMPRLMPLFPHHTHFVDLFGGSAAAILTKPPSKIESFNDRSSRIYNLFRLVRDGGKDLERLKYRIEKTPQRCFQTFREAQQVFASPSDDSVINAWAFLVVHHQGHVSSSANRLSRGNWAYFRDDEGGRAGKWLKLPLMLDYIRHRFRKVQIFQHDAVEIVNKLDDPDVFIYADPPYLTEEPMYEVTMSLEDHERLLKRLNRCKAKVMLSNYPNKIYDRMLKGWKTKTMQSQTHMAHGIPQPRMEKIWANFPLGEQ